MAEDFAYHRSHAPVMWVFLGLATVELFAVHLLSSLWSATLAWTLSALSILTILWIIGLIRSLRRRPVMIAGDMLAIRFGHLVALDVPLGHVATVQRHFASDELKTPGILDLSLMTYPNILLSLSPPVTSRRGKRIASVALRLDDPDALAAAIDRFRAGQTRAKAG